MAHILYYLIGSILLFTASIVYNLKCSDGKELSPAQILFSSLLWPAFVLGVFAAMSWNALDAVIDRIKKLG